MKLSTKGRYAVTAMMAVAMREGRKPITLAEISVDQGISISYLEQLFARLRKNGLVKGMRGPGGGYTLGKQAADITVAEIITTVDDKAYIARSEDRVYWVDNEARQIQDLWRDLSGQIHDFLQGFTLEDMISKTRSKFADKSEQDDKAA